MKAAVREGQSRLLNYLEFLTLHITTTALVSLYILETNYTCKYIVAVTTALACK